MKIFLIGFMGSGKSTLGKKLALKLGYHFVDIDKVIEAEIKISIAEYFQKNGENAFRQLENSMMKSIDLPENVVVATGGGAPCFFDNLAWMNQNGVTLYLSLSPKALVKRLENGIGQRPVLQNLSGQELEEFISVRLKEREEYYQQAKLTIKGPDQTAEKVIEILTAEAYLK